MGNLTLECKLNKFRTFALVFAATLIVSVFIFGLTIGVFEESSSGSVSTGSSPGSFSVSLPSGPSTKQKENFEIICVVSFCFVMFSLDRWLSASKKLYLYENGVKFKGMYGLKFKEVPLKYDEIVKIQVNANDFSLTIEDKYSQKHTAFVQKPREIANLISENIQSV